MKYERFEDLPVWQAAADLAAIMFTWTQDSLFRGKGDLARQMQRACLSISNNIAEGFERGSPKELLTFLYIARGSVAEVRSMLCVMSRMPCFDTLEADLARYKADCESISRQLRAWAQSLQDSRITGNRYLTEQSKADYERQIKREQQEEKRRQWQAEFEKKLKEQYQAKRDSSESDSQPQ